MLCGPLEKMAQEFGGVTDVAVSGLRSVNPTTLETFSATGDTYALKIQTATSAEAQCPPGDDPGGRPHPRRPWQLPQPSGPVDRCGQPIHESGPGMRLEPSGRA